MQVPLSRQELLDLTVWLDHARDYLPTIDVDRAELERLEAMCRRLLRLRDLVRLLP
jgi:hypothetical protein